MAKLVAIGMIAIIAAINVAGTRKSTDFQNWTTAIKVGAIVLISVLLLAGGKGFHGATVALPAFDKTSLLAIGAATIGVLWAYDGWIYVTFSAGEVVEPQRNFARGIIVGTLAVVALYLLVNVAYIAALGPARSAASERIAADAAVAVLGPWAGKLVALAILISIFSSTHAMVLTASRVYFAMARDGVFFKRMGEISPRWNTPAFAILTSSIWAAALAATGRFDELMTDVVFTAFAFYALGAASIFYYRRREPNAVRRFRTPGYPWTPLLFIGAGAAIVANTVIGTPGRAFVGTALVVSGAPVFLVLAITEDEGAAKSKSLLTPRTPIHADKRSAPIGLCPARSDAHQRAQCLDRRKLRRYHSCAPLLKSVLAHSGAPTNAVAQWAEPRR